MSHAPQILRAPVDRREYTRMSTLATSSLWIDQLGKGPNWKSLRDRARHTLLLLPGKAFQHKQALPSINWLPTPTSTSLSPTSPKGIPVLGSRQASLLETWAHMTLLGTRTSQVWAPPSWSSSGRGSSTGKMRAQVAGTHASDTRLTKSHNELAAAQVLLSVRQVYDTGYHCYRRARPLPQK